ncbi:uncharacterized protein LOC106654732 [Trichogramma pretiosum]|uniref:uncharacterized protein LOC106654732 n=1 Tax=Trichogramma pretiosum TaxID=7493 RepID=UPI0006C9D896|nr:uncharacterized protein LOC106654732 [Trichogramma pretiosum]
MTLEKDKPAPGQSPRKSPRKPSIDQLLITYRPPNMIQKERTPPRPHSSSSSSLSRESDTPDRSQSNEALTKAQSLDSPALEGAQTSGDEGQLFVQKNVAAHIQSIHKLQEQAEPLLRAESPVVEGPLPASPKSTVKPPDNLLGPVSRVPILTSDENDISPSDEGVPTPETDARTVDNPVVIYQNPASENPEVVTHLPSGQGTRGQNPQLTRIQRLCHPNLWDLDCKFWTGVLIFIGIVVWTGVMIYYKFKKPAFDDHIRDDHDLPVIRRQWGHH